MTLNLPNVPFADGDAFTAEMAYEAFYSPIFDGNTSLLGHRELIRDDELSSTGVKGQVLTLTNSVKATVTSGLTVSWTSGLVLTPLGEIQSIASGSVVVPDNTTSYIYVDNNNTVVVGLSRSVLRVTLAKVVAVGGTITSLTDFRHPAILRSLPPSFLIRSFGGQSTVDKTCTNGETLKGVIECRNFTIPAGITVTVDKYCRVVASGKVDIYGSANVTQQAPGAPQTQYGLLTVGGYVGFTPGQGLGNGGTAYSYSQQAYGSGGSLGYLYNRPGNASNSWGFLRKGGDGGGSFLVEAAGNITVYTSAVITAKGGDGLQPGSVDGSFTLQCLGSGSGAGSGGCVSLISASLCTIQAGATVDVRGGNGGNGYIYTPGYAQPLFAAPGAPGSGGYLITIGVSGVNTSGFTFLNTGGTWGTWASINGAVTIVSANSISFLNTTFGLTGGGLGGGFAGVGGNTSGVSAGVPLTDTVTMLAAGVGIQVISTNLPS